MEIYGVAPNLLAVIVAAVVNMAIGAAWYGPLFGKTWMQLVGKTEADLRKGNVTQMYVISAVGALVLSYILAVVVGVVGASTIIEGATIGFWMWLGFAATTSLPHYLFGGERKKLFALDTAYHLVAIALMGGILAVWV